MSSLLFDGDELSLTLFDSNGTLKGRWSASNNGRPLSDHRVDSKEAFLQFLPDGEYPFSRSYSTHPKRHSGGQDTIDGKYGTLGTFVLDDVHIGGQVHKGLAVHAGRSNVYDTVRVSSKPLFVTHNRGADYRTQGCIRTTEPAMEAIAHLARKDALTVLKVRNNGRHPIGKSENGKAERLSPTN